MADRYERWPADGVHVVTPNKKANSGALDRYERIQKAAKEGKRNGSSRARSARAFPW